MYNKITSIFLLCLGLFASTATAQKALYKAAFGVQTYTFRNHFPKGIAATLDSIKALGFTEIEAGVPKGTTAEEFRKMCDERGLKIPSTGAGYDELVSKTADVVKTAKTLGAKYVMCAWIPHQNNVLTIADAQKAVADFNAAGKILKENGLVFCYHDHGYEFQPYGGGTLMDYLIQKTDPKYVSFEMDVLWTIHGGGNPVALLQKYKKRWKLMHLKDLKTGVKGDLTGHTPAENDVPLGTGQADFKEILKAAKKAGVEHYFIEDESEKEMINVRKSMVYLKELKG